MVRADRLTFRLLLLACVLPWGAGKHACASGPRFVTGPPFFTAPAGLPIGWKQQNLLYYTDPGDLSSAVNHSAADALVAAAAKVWNVPVASITVDQGGALAEHVSGVNTYLDTAGMVFPADVMSSNAAAVPIAVIYDTDGSVTDTLLGGGASGPSQCRQNAVTETVDSFDPAGYILHALIVLNGRCTGAAPQMQQEMQYKLERAFGRVLGLAWSQTNDNVFTGVPAPTYNQAMNWPIMHPLEIICGPYSFQCLPSPMQLRPDDVASMVALYPIAENVHLSVGKQQSLLYAASTQGVITFPNGQGMAGVNVLVQTQAPYAVADPWYATSAVSGGNFRQAGTSPFVPADTSALGSMGSFNQGFLGEFSIPYTPIADSRPWQSLIYSTEPVNSLYIGQYSLGPYAAGNVTPSGSSPSLNIGVGNQFAYASVAWNIPDAASACGNGTDGASYAPTPVPSTGWWNGVLCGYGHSAYTVMNVQPGRSLTVEVTALDAQGLATETKAMPVIGLFAPTDAWNDLPSLGVTASAFQGRNAGTTTAGAQTGQLTGVRIGIADQRGDGRPDFTYQARVFYADSVSPVQLPAAGGLLTIAGLGFRPGNGVTINGVAASVVSWTANAIVVHAPAMAAAGALSNVPLDVKVSDISTGASSNMTAVLTYTAQPAQQMILKVVSAPSGQAYVGDAMAAPFTLQLLASDAVTPVAGGTIILSATAGSVRWAACGAATCSLRTDANGLISSGVTPLTAGAIRIQAADGALMQSVNLTALAQVASMMLVSAPSGNLPVTIAAGTPFTVRDVAADGSGMGYRAITFSVASGSATFSGCFSQTCTVTGDYSGTATVYVTPTGVGPVTLLATDGDARQSPSFVAVSNQDSMQVISVPTGNAYVGNAIGRMMVRLLRPDAETVDNGKPIVFTASDGVLIEACNGQVCSLSTDSSGYAGVDLFAEKAGTFTVQASFGGLSQTVSVTVLNHTMQLVLVSAPAGDVPVGTTAATPFSLQLLQDGVTPVPSYQVGVNGPQDSVLLNACGLGLCSLTTDVNGMISTPVTPLKAGVITLSAVFSPQVVTSSFTATGAIETMQVVVQPGSGGVMVGDNVNLTVQLIGSDGVTVYSYRAVTFSVASGSFGFTSCRFASCGSRTDENGMASISGLAWGAGPVSIVATEALASATINFRASSKPDVMRLLSAPASGGYQGTAGTTPFAVQVLFADGSTTAPGKSVTLSVTKGAAGFAACGGSASCVVQTNSLGIISTAVTPLSAGPITISAADGGAAQTATFAAMPMPEVMQIVSVPAGGSAVGIAADMPFAVRLLGGDGSSPLAGRSVTISVTDGSAHLGACSLASCVLLTDAAGIASTTVSPMSSGPITVLAAEGTLIQSATFTALAQPDRMNLISAPADGSFVGDVAALPFSLQVVPGDHSAPQVRSVTLTVTNGSARLAACGGISCVLTTDARGMVSTGVIPLGVGVVSLAANEGPGGAISQTASFRAVSKPDALSLLSAPGTSVFAGARAATAFSVRLLQGDGLTPVAGAMVKFQSSGEAVHFGGCAAAVCTVATDANGVASASVTGVNAGAVTLTASADPSTGAAPVSLAFQVIANVYAVSAMNPAAFIAEGAAFRTALTVAASVNGIAAGGATMRWSASQGLALGASASVAANDGSASMPAMVGPLTAGGQAAATVCGWTNTCAQFMATGVAIGSLQIALMNGANQSVTGGASLTPIVAKVTDAAGDPVMGAPVSIYQTVTALDVPCPATGRCPAAPVLLSKTTVVVSDGNGTVTLAPLTAEDAVAKTEVAFSVGTQGFATAVLTVRP